MPARLTPVQVRALQPGDRVSRVARPGEIHTAPVERVTATHVVITWPDGEVARYWRESGTRTDCRGEQLMEPAPTPEEERDAWIAAVNLHLAEEAERHALTVDEQFALANALKTHGTAEWAILGMCARLSHVARDTATLIIRETLKRRLPVEQSAPTWTAPPADWSLW